MWREVKNIFHEETFVNFNRLSQDSNFIINVNWMMDFWLLVAVCAVRQKSRVSDKDSHVMSADLVKFSALNLRLFHTPKKKTFR